MQFQPNTKLTSVDYIPDGILWIIFAHYDLAAIRKGKIGKQLQNRAIDGASLRLIIA
jgi:hypothetical protein